MNVLDEWHFLISALRLHIAEEYPDLVIKQKVSAPPPAAPKKPPSPPPPAAKKPIPAVKAKELPIEIPTMPLEPVMQALCRPVTRGFPISLAGTVSTLESLGIKTLDAPEDKACSLVLPASILFVSFFQPKSDEEQFLQKVVSAVSERILPCSLYTLAGLSCAAECFTLAAHGVLKGLILAYPQQEAHKPASWLAYFGQDIEHKEHELELLKSKRALFSTAVYELNLTPTHIADVGFKRALWNDLQRLV